MTHSDSRRRDVEILKRDARGRVRTSVRQREAILDEFERSGLSGPKFSQVAGVDELRLAHLEIQLLRQKLEALARRLFGRSSEKLDAAQITSWM